MLALAGGGAAGGGAAGAAFASPVSRGLLPFFALKGRDAAAGGSMSGAGAEGADDIWGSEVQAQLRRLLSRSIGCCAQTPPPSCTDWTRLVLLPVLTGHVSSFSPY